MTAALDLVSLAASSSKSSSSGSSATLLILLVVGAGFYFLFFRPQQRKQKALREQQRNFEVGDEVLTAGGLVGHVIDIEGDRVTLETSVGASFVVLKQYVVRRIEEPAAEAEEDESEDETSGALEAGTDDHEDEQPEPEDESEDEDEDEHDVGSPTRQSSTNGRGSLDAQDAEDGHADMWGEDSSKTEDPASSGRTRRSGRRKRRAPGGTPGTTGPDNPTSS